MTQKEGIVFDETQESINKLIKQKLKITTITKSEFELGYNNPWLNDYFFIPIRSGSKRIKDKNIKSLPRFKFGLTEIKIKQIKKFKNLIKKFKIKQDFEFIVSTNCEKTKNI